MATAFSPRGMHQRAREALLASNWWAAAIRGVIAILIGSFAILAPAVTLIALVMIFAAYSLVDGVFAIVLAIRGARKHERWGWLAFNGVVSIAAATVAILFPGPTIVAFAILFAVWAIVSGSASVAAGLGLGKSHGRWWLIAGGVITILFGVWAIFDLGLGMLALSYLFGFQALFAGFTLLALAYHLRERKVEETADSTANFDAKAPREAHHG
jgi:uncharacterized membrane protein HdeD (DUF308 family)